MTAIKDELSVAGNIIVMETIHFKQESATSRSVIKTNILMHI